MTIVGIFSFFNKWKADPRVFLETYFGLCSWVENMSAFVHRLEVCWPLFMGFVVLLSFVLQAFWPCFSVCKHYGLFCKCFGCFSCFLVFWPVFLFCILRCMHAHETHTHTHCIISVDTPINLGPTFSLSY